MLSGKTRNDKLYLTKHLTQIPRPLPLGGCDFLGEIEETPKEKHRPESS